MSEKLGDFFVRYQGARRTGRCRRGLAQSAYPEDDEGVGPHRHRSRVLHGVFGSISWVLEAETALDPTEGFFEGPSLAIQFDDLLRGQVEVGTGEYIVLLGKPLTDHLRHTPCFSV